MKVNKWLDNFVDLEPEQQLEIANAIFEELIDNEDAFGEDGYNTELSESVRGLIDRFIFENKNKKDLKKVQEILKHFKELSVHKKEKVITELESLVDKYYKKEIQEQKEHICQNEGHIMGEWEKSEWTSYEDGWIDHQYVYGIKCHHEGWSRICERCGFKEAVTEEPEEVRINREEQEKQQKIKRLEKELNELKGNN